MATSLAPALDLIFPPRCPACGEGIGQQNGLCKTCWNELIIPSEPACARCQRPFTEHGVQDGAMCVPCLAHAPIHSGIAAGTLYTDVSRKLVLAFKHGGRIALAPMLARLIAARLPEPAPERLIVPVPLYRWRLWRRGYNQAALLGQELASLGHGSMVVDALKRTRRTPSLGGLGGAARRKALAGAIAVSPARAAALAGREIILVDDVVTSGATTDACTMALVGAGARSVRVACFARVLDVAVDRDTFL